MAKGTTWRFVSLRQPAIVCRPVDSTDQWRARFHRDSLSLPLGRAGGGGSSLLTIQGHRRFPDAGAPADEHGRGRICLQGSESASSARARPIEAHAVPQ